MKAIVTGASRGVGYELVKQFCRDGFETVIAISRNEKNLEKLKAECLAEIPNSTVICLPFDLGAESDWQSLVDKVKQDVDHLDILVNNAGSLVHAPFASFSIHDAKRIFDVNFFAVFALTQALLPLMGGTAGSHVVNIGSMGGVQGSAKFAGLSAYSASKGAVATLSECLAEELKDENIKVNCLALGAVQTEMLAEAFPGYEAPVQPEEMASFISNFARNDGRFINGKVVSVSISTP
jgi:3-oxoacyl-[acyl-carrier protein] reductase